MADYELNERIARLESELKLALENGREDDADILVEEIYDLKQLKVIYPEDTMKTYARVQKRLEEMYPFDR